VDNRCEEGRRYGRCIWSEMLSRGVEVAWEWGAWLRSFFLFKNKVTLENLFSVLYAGVLSDGKTLILVTVVIFPSYKVAYGIG